MVRVVVVPVVSFLMILVAGFHYNVLEIAFQIRYFNNVFFEFSF